MYLRNSQRLGANAALTKPFRLQALTRLIDTTLAETHTDPC